DPIRRRLDEPLVLQLPAPPARPARVSGEAINPGEEPVEQEQEPAARLIAWVRGRVQGVGFRWWVRARALELGLTGAATNLADGRVEVVAEGPSRCCAELLTLL